MQKNVLTGETFTLRISPTNAAGEVATVQDIVWASTDETVLTVEPSDDLLSALITIVGTPNFSASVTVSAYCTQDMNQVGGDSNALNPPQPDVTDQFDFTVVIPNATALNLALVPTA